MYRQLLIFSKIGKELSQSPENHQKGLTSRGVSPFLAIFRDVSYKEQASEN
ncbi:hypothetical protein OXB_0824 [Bacillus sp. OxB-1]|nr:hypothetical protein OXB_0824 [Bacillus sp. OxB-1]